MTVVIADASPLNYLILIGELDVLPKLFGRVVVPTTVCAELRDAEAPTPVAYWAANLPTWADEMSATATADASLEKLGDGERAAIELAQEQTGPVLLLVDELAGRREAERRQLPVIGTLGILRLAARQGWVDLPDCFARLRQTNFREPRKLMTELLAEDATWRGGKNTQ